MQYRIIEKSSVIINTVSALVDRIVDKELIVFKRNQQLAGNGGEFDTSHLDVLQNW